MIKKTCPKCEEQIPNDSCFCDICGVKLPYYWNYGGLVLKSQDGDLVIKPIEEAIIGRADSPYQEILKDFNLISRHHAKFTKQADEWFITDLGSTNGTLVNDEELVPNQPTAIYPGDIVDLGTYLFEVVNL